MSSILILTIGGLLFMLLQLSFFMTSYIRCPPNKILVVYGKISQDPDEKYKIFKSGSVFVWPVIQAYALIDAEPIDLEINTKVQMKDARQASVDVKLKCGISKVKELTIKSVELFYRKEKEAIAEIVHDRLLSKIERYIYQKNDVPMDQNTTALKIAIEDIVIEDLSEIGMDLVVVESVRLS